MSMKIPPADISAPKKILSKNNSYEDKNILTMGNPEMVYLLYDEDKNKTTVKLVSDKNCFYKKDVEGNKKDYYKKLYQDNTDLSEKNIVEISSKKGNKNSGIKAFELDAQTRAQFAKALIAIQNERKAQKVFLETPVYLKNFDDGKPHSMDFETFADESKDNFDVYNVLTNLSDVGKETFTPSNIDEVTLSGDGTRLTFSTKDNKFAMLDFKTGQRTVNITEDGELPDFNVDYKGPVIKPFGYSSRYAQIAEN